MLNKDPMTANNWVDVCDVNELIVNDGICCLIDDQQVAIFRIGEADEIYAIGNYDPIGKANVLSRGIVGDIDGEPVVASPLYKQHFSLITGKCIEDDNVSVPVYQLKVIDGRVHVLTDSLDSL